MPSQITVRLNEDLTEQIDLFAKKLRRKRSDVVRLALERFLFENKELRESRPYDQVRGLIGSVSSGFPNLGEAHREYLVKKFKKDA
ncbi:MAG: ribbon-helix-helix domain-containing protein [Thermodesulfobacteriota bacterium]